MAMDDDAGLSRGAGVDSFGGMPTAVAPQPVPPVQPQPVSPQPAPSVSPPPVAPAPPLPVAPPPPPPLEVQAPDAAVKAYIERCVRPQQVWFSKKAAKCKRAHYAIITAQVVATTSIPLLNMLTLRNVGFTYLSTAAAAISGLAAGVAGMGKFKEHWLRYRQNATTLEELQLEYELFLPPFHGPDRNNLLISTVRRILSDEQKLWIADVRSGTLARAAAGVAPMPPRPSPQGGGSSDDDS